MDDNNLNLDAIPHGVSWGVINNKITPCEDIESCVECKLYDILIHDKYNVSGDCENARKFWSEHYQEKENATIDDNDTIDDNEAYRITPKGILYCIFMDLEIPVSDAVFDIIWELFETRMTKMGYIQEQEQE